MEKKRRERGKKKDSKRGKQELKIVSLKRIRKKGKSSFQKKKQ